ncbi:MAG: hypothetical protein HY721_13080 [Planctomycetes bacterium]|nr:hypothetical protein [Planctomycetota bacterium]
MFSTERIVRVTQRTGSITSFFIDKRFIREDGRVAVEVFEREGVTWACLPTDHPYHPEPVRAEDVEPCNDELVCP